MPLKILWAVSTGAPGPGRPQETTITDSELSRCATDEDRRRLIREAVQADFEDRVSWSGVGQETDTKPETPPEKMVFRKTWEEFRAVGMLWWVNRILHVFGWAIVTEVEEDGTVTDAYPARVKFRGFAHKNEEEGHRAVSDWLAENVSKLKEEADG